MSGQRRLFPSSPGQGDILRRDAPGPLELPATETTAPSWLDDWAALLGALPAGIIIGIVY